MTPFLIGLILGALIGVASLVAWILSGAPRG